MSTDDRARFGRLRWNSGRLALIGLLFAYPLLDLYLQISYALEYGTVFRVLHLLPAVSAVVLAVGIWHARSWAYIIALPLAVLACAVCLLILTSYPLGSRLDPFTAALLLVTAANEAAVVLLWRSWKRNSAVPAGARVHSTIVWKQAAVLEIGLMALIGMLGMNDNWYQLAALTPHLPAVLILSRMGVCCGFASHLVISDAGMSYWGGLTLAGVPMLMIANFAALVPFLMLIRFARRRIDGARRVAPASAV